MNLVQTQLLSKDHFPPFLRGIKQGVWQKLYSWVILWHEPHCMSTHSNSRVILSFSLAFGGFQSTQALPALLPTKGNVWVEYSRNVSFELCIELLSSEFVICFHIGNCIHIQNLFFHLPLHPPPQTPHPTELFDNHLCHCSQLGKTWSWGMSSQEDVVGNLP